MKIRAKTAFVSGRYSGNAGDLIEIPEVHGEKLIRYGIAEAAESASPASVAGASAASKGKAEEVHTAKANAPKRAKTTPKKGGSK